jgi:YtcA family
MASFAAQGSLGALAGCGRVPSFNILGYFFPAWLICIGAGIALAAIAALGVATLQAG